MPGRPKFLSDAMLGSLSRKLRIFGFDTLYLPDVRDSELEDVAARDGRVILTSDRGLFEHSRRGGLRVLLVDGRTERERLRSLVEAARECSVELIPGESRCAVCNGEMVRLTGRDVAGELPPRVAGRHRVYFRCVSCGKLYWKGRHWERLRRLSMLLKARERI